MASIGNLLRKLRTLTHVAALIVTRENPSSIVHASRTAVAAVVSLLVAHLFRLPEAYWSPISTLVIMQSTLGASLPVSAQRFAGTAFGAIVGGLIGSYFPGNVLAFGVCVLLIGLVCTAFNVQRAAYRFANITLSLVMLIPRPHYQWTIALHRFIEVSIGIAVGLAISAFWPERKSSASTVAPTEVLPASPPLLAGVREQSGQ
jgi:uncharacterized membrane protein YccC